MAINPGNGVLDITNGIIKVSSIDVQDSGGFNTTINTVARNNILLYDDQESTTNFIPQSNNDYQSTAGVTRDTTNKYIELNSASDDGWIYWPLKLPNVWKAEFDMNITASGGLFIFTFFNTSAPNNANDLSNDGGYKIIFDNTNNTILFRLQGVLKSTTSVNLRSNDWQRVNINYYYGQTSVSIDGTMVASYRFTEDQHESDHKYVGFSAKTGTIHKIRKININNADKWTFTDDSNASDICYLNGNVGIGTTTTDYLFDVHGNAHVSENLTVVGNLNVLGTTTVVQIQDLQVESAIMELGNNNTSDTIDLGIVMNRPTANVVIGFRGDESELAIGYTHSDPSGSHLVPIADGALKTTIYGNLHSNNITTGGLTVDDGFSMGSHILPTVNDTYDIGSAEYKIRDLYVADNSLWIGDEAKISYSGGKMKFRKRKMNTVPITVAAAGGTESGAKTFAGVSNLSDVKAHHWLNYMRTLSGQSNAKMTDIFRDHDDDYEYTSSSGSWSDVGDDIQTSQNIAIGKASAPTASLDVVGASIFTGNITTTGNIGVNKTSPTADVHVVGYQYINDAPTVSSSFDHTTAPLTLTNSTVTSTSAVNDPSPVLHLTREGTSSQSYGARATMDLCRWENSGTNSRSRLDFQLAEGTYANTHVMSLRSDGRVGIGTTNPASALHVTGVITHNHNSVSGVEAGVYNNVIGKIEITSAASNRSCIDFKVIGGDSNFSERIGGGLGHLQFITNRNEAMRISSAGNLGIGTDSPVGKLDVYDGASNESDIQQNAHVYIRNPASAATDYGACLVFENTDGFPANSRKSLGRISALRENYSANYNSYLQFKPTLNSTEFEAMRITSGGKVGIGVTNPAYKLDVDGDLNLSTGSTLRINGTPAVFSNWTVSSSDIYRSSGKVGIGTTSPASALHVTGALGTSGVTVPGIELGVNSTQANIEITSATNKSGWIDFKTVGNNEIDEDRIRGGKGTLHFLTQLAERFTITNSGNSARIGVGVASPNYTVDVQDPVDAILRIKTTGSSGDADAALYIDSAADGEGDIDFLHDGVMSWRIRTGTDAQGGFQINNQTGATVFGLTQTGMLGIGTPAPTSVLEIVGNGTSAIMKKDAAAATNTYNLVLQAPRPGTSTGGVSHYINGSTRTQNNEGGASTYTIRNDSGNIRIGHSSYKTFFAGDVGIGTTDPNRTFQIYDDADNYFSFSANESALDSNIGNVTDFAAASFRKQQIWRLKGRTWYWGNVNNVNTNIALSVENGTDPDPDIQLMVDGSTGTLYTGGIRAKGNVGIGTASPSGTLEIESSSAGQTAVVTPTTQLVLSCNDANAGDVGDLGAGLTFKQKWYNPNATLTATGGIYGVKTMSHGSYGGGLAFFRGPNAGNNLTEAMRIDHDGNVGIGTNNPLSTLQVGDGTGATSGDAPGSISLAGTGATKSNGGKPGLYHRALVGLGLWSDGKMSFEVNGYNGNQIEAMRILETGNVGIGTTNPSAKFHVDGSTAFDGSNTVHFRCAASQYGRNQLKLIGRYEAGNDAWSATGARNAIMFKYQTSSTSAYTDAWTIQSFPNGTSNDLGFLSGTNNTPRVTFRGSNGNVGIGTTGPASALHIKNTSANCLYVAGNNAGNPTGGLTHTTQFMQGFRIHQCNGTNSSTAGGSGWASHSGGVVNAKKNGITFTQGAGNPNIGSSSIYWTIGMIDEINTGWSNFGFAFGGQRMAYVNKTNNNNELDFTGQHRSYVSGVPFSKYKDYEGLIVSANKNEYYDIDENATTGLDAIQISQSLPLVSVSNVAMDKACFGVISGVEDPDTREYSQGRLVSVAEKIDGDSRAFINSVGEGAIWVINTNGNLESGDYITTSTVAGYGMKQNDDILHNYTVAKITMDCDFNPATKAKRIVKTELRDVTYYSNATSNISYIESDYMDLGDEEKEQYTLDVKKEPFPVLDSDDMIQWENHASDTEKAYKLRYLDANGVETAEADKVYTAAFVGCTYHCG